MIYEILPYIYIAGAAFDVLLVGTATLAVFGAPSDSRWVPVLALVAALFTWAVAAFVLLDPAAGWLRMGEMAVWIPLSAICVALVWYCRPPAREEPPAPPPQVFPKINGQWPKSTQTTTTQRTYRLRTRKS